MLLKTSKGNTVTPLEVIIKSNSKLETLKTDFKFTEGPVWHPDGFLLFSDIPVDTIYKWTPEGKIEIFRQGIGNPNGNTFDNQGRLITALHRHRRLIRTEKNGEITVLAERYQNQRLNSPNDVVVASNGSIYFSDPPYGISKDKQELGFSGIYRLLPDGTLTLLHKEMFRPNGLAFSPDEKKLYVNDSEQGYIRVFEVDSNGLLTNNKIFAKLPGPSNKAVLDGMKIDVQGNIYSSSSEGVWIFSPSGELLGKIPVPNAVTNLAWGDKDYKTLYLTAGTSLYRIRLNITGIQPGRMRR